MKFILIAFSLLPLNVLACTTADMSKIADELVSKIKKSRTIEEAFMSDPHLRGEGKDQIYEAYLYLKLKVIKDGKTVREVELITAKMDGKACIADKPFFLSELNAYPAK